MKLSKVVKKILKESDEQEAPLDNNAIADWIKKKDSNSAFQKMAWAVRQGDMELARQLAQEYKGWFSEYEIEFFKKNGLL